MKRILILRSDSSPAVEHNYSTVFAQSLQDGLKSMATITTATFAELGFEAGDAAYRIWHIAKGWDIADFDLVIFRKVGSSLELAIAAAHYLRSKNTPFIDDYIYTLGSGKLAGAFMRREHNIPVPHTLYASKDLLEQAIASSTLNFPFIFKDDHGSKGRDNFKISSLDELSKAFDATTSKRMIVQEFIENDGDFRILVMNNKASLVIKRKTTNSSHLNNTSQGGSAVTVPVKSIPKDIIKDVLVATKLEKLSVAGADVIIDSVTKKHYLLEVNRAPQLGTGANVDEKLAVYIEMVDELLGAKNLNTAKSEYDVVGRAEEVSLPELEIKDVPARIDTGAKTSAIWASDIHVKNGVLYLKLFDKESPYYTGKILEFQNYDRRIVASSIGDPQDRYVIELLLRIKARNIRATFTLANRSKQVYPVLIGRNVLRGKFIVNPKIGKPMLQKEKQRSSNLQKRINRKADT